jgi:hypothetical protein
LFFLPIKKKFGPPILLKSNGFSSRNNNKFNE